MVMHNPQPIRAAAVLDAAADLILKEGWRQGPKLTGFTPIEATGTLLFGTGNQATPIHAMAIGAMAEILNWNYQVCDSDAPFVVVEFWNTTVAKDVAEVVAVMRQAAGRLRDGIE